MNSWLFLNLSKSPVQLLTLGQIHFVALVPLLHAISKSQGILKSNIWSWTEQAHSVPRPYPYGIYIDFISWHLRCFTLKSQCPVANSRHDLLPSQNEIPKVSVWLADKLAWIWSCVLFVAEGRVYILTCSVFLGEDIPCPWTRASISCISGSTFTPAFWKPDLPTSYFRLVLWSQGIDSPLSATHK